MPLATAAIAAFMFALARRRAFILTAAAVVIVTVIGAVVLLIPKANDEWSVKSLSLRAAAELRPGERITFFIVKEFAPVFYAEGRVVCGEGEGTVLNALSQDILAETLENEPSLIVFTLSRWQDDLEDDPRFATHLIGQQGDSLAYRVWLKR